MYLSYYNLKKMPFQAGAEADFLWFGDMHTEALATLEHGLLENKGVMLLTGESGAGKTTLIDALVHSLRDEVLVAKLSDPRMEKLELMNFISYAFGMGKEFFQKETFLVHFSQFLHAASAKKKIVLLILDEAQRLTLELLEEIRQLADIEKDGEKLFNILLVGQNELSTILQKSGNNVLGERISLSYTLNPLSLPETCLLIEHQLGVAGADRDLFDPAALRAIFDCTGGLPGKITALCHHCLIAGFEQRKAKISEGIARGCFNALRFPGIPAEVPENETAPEATGEALTGLAQNSLSLPSAGRKALPIGFAGLLVIAVLAVSYGYFSDNGGVVGSMALRNENAVTKQGVEQTDESKQPAVQTAPASHVMPDSTPVTGEEDEETRLASEQPVEAIRSETDEVSPEVLPDTVAAADTEAEAEPVEIPVKEVAVIESDAEPPPATAAAPIPLAEAAPVGEMIPEPLAVESTKDENIDLSVTVAEETTEEAAKEEDSLSGIAVEPVTGIVAEQPAEIKQPVLVEQETTEPEVQQLLAEIDVLISTERDNPDQDRLRVEAEEDLTHLLSKDSAPPATGSAPASIEPATATAEKKQRDPGDSDKVIDWLLSRRKK